MRLSDFDFSLPPSLIATKPSTHRPSSKLLCLTETGLTHRHFYDISDLLEPGDLLVFNDTKVIPARLFGHKKTGGKVEVLIERIIDAHHALAQLRVSKSPKAGDEIIFANDVRFQIQSREHSFYMLYTSDNIHELIDSLGEIPLPHYMQRAPVEEDMTRYQTVYAKHKGSVAAPTAGLHFDEPLLQQLSAKGVEMAYLTLHIGAGTFAPVRTEDITQHKMHTESITLSQEVCAKIKKAKANNKRVIAVGTTSMRALETAAQSGEISSFTGETQIFIYPGYSFQCVDALITNFHLPRSTLLMLVCAFAGKEAVMQAYHTAIQHAYRFFSYGDAMWLTKAQ